MFGMNDPWKNSFQFAPCRDLCFDLYLLQGQFILPRPGDNNYPNLLVKFTFTLLFRHDVIIQGEITCHISKTAAFYENDDVELINILNARRQRQASAYCCQ